MPGRIAAVHVSSTHLAVRYECDCAAARGAIGYRLALDLPEAAEARAATARREGVILGKERSRQAF